MRIRRFIAAVLGVAALGLGACTTTLKSRPDYVSAGLAAPLIKGHAVLIMSAGEQSETLDEKPRSYTGAATSVILPIGRILGDVGAKILDRGFSEGAELSDASKAGAYGVRVRLDGFSYKYDQLSSLGFTIKPKVTIGVTSEATNPNGDVLIRKQYQRTDYTVGAYVASLEPAEKINESLHLALGEIVREMLDDIAKADRAKSSARQDK